MPGPSLAETLDAEPDTIAYLRGLDTGAVEFPHVPDEVTNWIEEQRAWRESVALADQSHHMTELNVSGPDALALFDHLGVNSFDPFPVGQAKQLVVCNPEGYLIGDGICFHLDEEEFLLVGGPAAPNWVEYHAETGDWAVATERQGSSRFDQAVEADPEPKRFRFQIQGPDALSVMDAVTADPLPELDFFHFGPMTIDGVEIQALRHGMAGEPGYEFWGPYGDIETVRSALLEAGAEYGIRELGTRSYQSTPVVVGWVPLPLPAVYGESTRDYREWLDADSYEGRASLGGSYVGETPEDYYLRPTDVGYGRLVDLDGDFVGKAGVAEALENPDRQLVTLAWHGDDVVDVYASLFADGPTKKFVDLLVPRWSAVHYDEVRADGELVGLSKWAGYIYNERTVLSLCAIDTDYAEPGTEVTLRWGEPDSTKQVVEAHEVTDIRATVGPVPYAGDRR